MAKELPWFKFNPSKWFSGDITLESMELQGVFLNVCATYWMKGCAIETAKLKQRYGDAIATLLKKGLIKENEGFAVIEFLDEQRVELQKRHERLSISGKKGAEIRYKNKPRHSHPIATRREEKRRDNTIVELVPFELFWEAYDKKVGKEKSEGLWKSIKDPDKELIMQYIPKYKKAQPTKKFRKDPQTFLRNRCWNDEIIEPTETALSNPTKLDIKF